MIEYLVPYATPSVCLACTVFLSLIWQTGKTGEDDRMEEREGGEGRAFDVC